MFYLVQSWGRDKYREATVVGTSTRPPTRAYEELNPRCSWGGTLLEGWPEVYVMNERTEPVGTAGFWQTGVDVADIQDLYGHTDPSTTVIYAALHPEQHLEVDRGSGGKVAPPPGRPGAAKRE